jgi:hypothetical protein
MHLIPYRDRLLQELCDPEFAMEYFVAVAQTADRMALEPAVKDLLTAGNGVYPLVEMTKLRACPNPANPTGNWAEFGPGEENESSLPVHHTLTGILIRPPRVGTSVIILRLNRYGIAVPGLYQSTKVIHVCDGEFVTMNSVYKIRTLRNAPKPAK